MATDGGKEKFRIFVSHKHEDHEGVLRIARALTGLDDQIECFVSGANIAAGTDWNAEIRTQLQKSHLLLLIFTEPSNDWDWCLFEAGLFSSLGDEEHSVVCLHRAGGSSPRPLKSLQSVPVQKDKVQSLLRSLCTETWRIARTWRYGALGPTVTERRISEVAKVVIEAFPKARAAAAPTQVRLTHFPCHRVVLDLTDTTGAMDRIPDNARVVEGEGATSTYTMSLFNFTRGQTSRTWKDLVEATGEAKGQWLDDLNVRYAAAIREKLFSPRLNTPLPVLDPHTGRPGRYYRPVLYEIQREAAADARTSGPESLRPIQLTLLLDPVADNSYPPPASASSPAPA